MDALLHVEVHFPTSVESRTVNFLAAQSHMGHCGRSWLVPLPAKNA